MIKIYKRILSIFLAVTLAFGAYGSTVLGCAGGSKSADLSSSSPQKGVVYYHTDHLGSSHLITDSQGNILREEIRYPYGLDRMIDGADVVSADYVYTGKEHDEETGLVYFGARYYAPELGRWITPDTLFLEDPNSTVKSPLESNLYAFVKGNPVKHIDLDGSFAWDIVDIGFFVYSLQDYFRNPCAETGINLALDTIGLAPAIPALGAIKRGAFAAVRGVNKADNLLKYTGPRVRPYIKNLDWGFNAYWSGNPRAVTHVDFDGPGVIIKYINKGDAPKYAGGAMLADALKGAGIGKPNHIIFHDIMNTTPTFKQLHEGFKFEDTLLGNTMKNTVDELGGKITEINDVTERFNKLSYEAVIKYE